MGELELDLYNDMVKIYKEADIQCNYRPTRFLQMLGNKGALVTAKELINKDGETEGFTRLYMCKRLDLSLEVLVLNKKYRQLFTSEEIKKCKERLSSYDYKGDEVNE